MGHISIVDLRETKKIWMMHVNAYSRCDYPMPIYGFDVVCGPKKLTGCFHDLSPTCASMPVDARFMPEKERELPLWALLIFSNEMVAAGNVTDKSEAKKLAKLGAKNLDRWFTALNFTEKTPSVMQEQMRHHTKYCHNQLQNPHSFRVMESLGFPADYLTDFKNNYQFPY